MDSIGVAIAITFGLIAAGALLLGAELFVIPGFGIVGIGGILMIGAACAYAWLTMGQAAGLAVCAASLLSTVALAIFALRSKTARKRLVLETSLSRGGGNEAASFQELVGHEGVAKTMLRPSGVALVDGRRIDVVSEGGFIEQGTPVQITLVDGPRVVVRRTNHDSIQGGNNP
ncbi:MAG: hypothetical protein MUC50_18310 [Myxococcota bacterium]|jgi:membrane-bound serine protease (ClpP class)|nr:hypothetical protein [Myxococcota bacterium]